MIIINKQLSLRCTQHCQFSQRSGHVITVKTKGCLLNNALMLQLSSSQKTGYVSALKSASY